MGTEERIEQDKAVEKHSLLYEQYLIENFLKEKEAKKHVDVHSAKVISTGLQQELKPMSMQQSKLTKEFAETMEEAWRESKNADVTELNAIKLEEVRLGKQELDTMNTAWKDTHAQQSEPRSELSKVIQQQSIETKGQQPNLVTQEQLPPPIGLKDTAQKAVIGMAKKIVASAAETLRMAMYVDPFEAPAVFHAIASTGLCAVPARPSVYNPELREAFLQYRAANSAKSFNDRVKISDPWKPLSNLLDGIELSRGDFETWLQQFTLEASLLGE